ncbi:hypothetical protein CBA19CS22_13650 [Caballeronia novacaledonica]|uniref:Uncharacterized protein n=1 Tax=Caballeronia novacaledonica TaxID=1544861 RepID=A0ACB5QR45_9BURK|nr:hypothetical protein CBA19CS22_13650 [Caballeronia novacaledonica]
MRIRVAEIDEQAIADIQRDMAFMGFDCARTGLMVIAQKASQILGIEALGERCRVDEIDEHHCDLPSLGLDGLTFRRAG